MGSRAGPAGGTGVPPTVVTVTMPLSMSRLYVTAVGAGTLVDAYDSEISRNSMTLPVEVGYEVSVEFWAMQAATYSCNGGPVQDAVWLVGTFYHYGTCQFTVSGGETVELWPK